MRRDPFESILPSSLLFGGVFLVAAAVKLVRLILRGTANVPVAQPEDSALPVFVFLVGFAVVIGPIVAFARRRMRKKHSYRAKNLVTGGLVGACYSLGCMIVFGGGMDAVGKLAVGALTFAGVWWAIASGLNEVFGEHQPRG